MQTFKDRVRAAVQESRRIDALKGLTLKPVQTSYTVDLGQEAYDALAKAERLAVARLTEPKHGLKPTLTERLELIAGVENVEYDGAFGPSVFLSITADCDRAKTKEHVIGVIQDQIKRAHDWP
ncbi:hypothetical protein HOU00_gp152 [Caulobacter phage CcrPW]|uniref:Uncharacterized protein n=1 Tax=Caulobacter phage CcrPW TaxID=2283271 RepID=A0A385EB07_9CAUD|nr:hypothetical protein HOU00_gp152 [Caulobacter phage CcrPW]AXQ68973.1 hypothetical protein CcrPW_gp434c [Caulobacter phage CcrPW]